VTEAKPFELSIAEAGRKLRDGSITSIALTEDALARIIAIDLRPRSQQLHYRDRRSRPGRCRCGKMRISPRESTTGRCRACLTRSRTSTTPAGIRSTCHSKLRADDVPAADLGGRDEVQGPGRRAARQLATHEFALGGPSFDLPFPPARNTWNREHIPGGSSSGSGAAVAAGLVRMAMGSDTGGSIRGPAAYCGTIGLKPYGLVSRRGVFPLSTTLDHAARCPGRSRTARSPCRSIAGYDPLDPASVDCPVPNFLDGLGQSVEGLRIGLAQHFFAEAQDVSAEGRLSDRPSRGDARKTRAVVEQITMPDYELFNACGQRHHVHRGLRHSRAGLPDRDHSISVC